MPNHIDMHRHLGGSIPAEFVWEVICDYKLTHLASSLQDVVAAMTFQIGEPYGFHRFLDKFKILNNIPWTPELIDLSIQAVCNELQHEQIDYCWMDFSVNKYTQYLNIPKQEIVIYIYELFHKYRPGQVGLVLSLKYESPWVQQIEYANLITDKDVAKCLIGIDLVGDEAEFDTEFYATLLPQWREHGKMVRAHVAESQRAENARDAIEYLQVTNIAHGLKLLEHPDMIDLVLNRRITFDLGITSNYLSGVCVDEDTHPISKMLELGFDVTYGTDDPVQCSTNIQTEYALLKYWFGITDSQLDKMTKIAARNSQQYDPRLTHLIF